jgi:hypothetical protein
MRKGRTLEIRDGQVHCPAKRRDQLKARCAGCPRFMGFTSAVVLCSDKPRKPVTVLTRTTYSDGRIERRTEVLRVAQSTK